MLGFLLGLLVRPIGLTLAGGALLLQGWWIFAATDEDLGFARRVLATRVAAQVAADLPDRPGAATLAVIPLSGDESGALRREIGRAVGGAGRYQMLDESLLQRFIAEVRTPAPPAETLEDAVAVARRIGADLVLFGQLVRFSVDDNGARVDLSLRLAERETGQAVFVRRYEEGVSATPTSVEYWRGRIADGGKPGRTVFWVLAVVLLPILLAPVVRRVTAEESNTWNLGLLMALTATGMGLAWLLTGFYVATLWTGVVLLLAGLLAAVYNYLVVSAMDELRR